MKAEDLGKASGLLREREAMLQNIRAIDTAETFYVKDARGRISDFQLEIGSSVLREPLLKWARAELMLIVAALQSVGVELEP